MTVYISGGSNSKMKNGWVSVFSRDHADLVNLSIGGCSSMMGAYRSIFGTGMQAGDTLVWEYALNDAHHVRQGHSGAHLLRFVEYIIIHCRRYGIHFAPIIFTPIFDEMNPERGAYFRQLHDLLRAYELEPFDMSIEYRQELGVKRLPRGIYLDPAHYVHDDNVLNFIARGAMRAVTEARVPADILPIYAGNKRLHLHDRFATERFKNSMLDVSAGLPPLSQTFDHDGELLTLIVLTTINDAAVEVRLAGHSVQMSATQLRGTFDKPMLKAFSCRRALGQAWLFSAGDSLEIRQSDVCAPAYAEVGCKVKLHNPLQNPQSLLVGILTES